MNPSAVESNLDRSQYATRWAAIAAITAGVVLAYGTSLNGPFVFDDVPAIVGNPTLRHPGELARLFFPPGMEAGTVAGRPLLNVSLALNFAGGGTAVWGYHLVNVLIHLATALLLFGLLRRTPWPGPRSMDAVWFAGGVALVWAVHPLATQAVTYVIQRAESLMSLFYLATLYCFVRGWKALALLACVAGMGCKEAMVSAPLAVLVYDRAFVAGSFRAAWNRNRGFYFLLGGTWLLLGALVLSSHGRGGSAGIDSAANSWSYLLTQSVAIATYLKLALWPSPLVFDYGTHLETSLAAVAGPAALVLLLIGLTGWSLVRRPRLGFLGFCFFAVLAPSSSFLPIATEPVAEQRMYLPLAAVVVLVFLALDACFQKARVTPNPRSRLILAAGVGLLAIGLVVATMARNRDYCSAVSLFADTVRKRPENPRAHNDLGTALREAGSSAAAGAQFTAAVQADPSYAPAQYNLGVLLLDQHRPSEALPHLEAARQIPRHQGELHLYLAQALDAVGRHQDAVMEAGRSLQQSPANPEAYFALGAAKAALGQYLAAGDAFAHAVALAPDQAGYRVNYANVLLLRGRVDEAIVEYREALLLTPSDAAIQANLRVALEQKARRTTP